MISAAFIRPRIVMVAIGYVPLATKMLLSTLATHWISRARQRQYQYRGSSSRMARSARSLASTSGR
jgi:hypothetical protein